MNKTPPFEIPLAIIGAGPSGLMLASFLREQNKKFVLFESQKQVGKKILISGGGRCNILPSQMNLDDFESYAPKKSLQRIVNRYPLSFWKNFFESKLGIPLALEADTGKLFPAVQSAKKLLKSWLEWLRLKEDELYLQHRLIDFEPLSTGGFLLKFEEKEAIQCRQLILATGGFSYPKTGSDGKGWQLLEHYVPLHKPAPALAPLNSPPRLVHRSLSGYALSVSSKAVNPQQKTLFTSHSNLLFTHFGYSGPAAMDLSYALKFKGTQFFASLLKKENREWKKLLEEFPKGKQVRSFLLTHFPKSFSDIILEEANIPLEQQFSDFRKEPKNKLLTLLSEYPLIVDGTRGFTKAEVTSGGVDLSEVNLKTLELKSLPGCYCLGELLDCTGRIGGYNFLWAFSTAAVVADGL